MYVYTTTPPGFLCHVYHVLWPSAPVAYDIGLDGGYDRNSRQVHARGITKIITMN